ncbi:porin [Chitiniphilus shinanonensis]|uniref:Porin n=1 Tax=Chitiniphilus shinanonensis TaxID=553088 RepID=A0ABQ6BMI5_9NEIS|nr:porin [Chitiniphilus shinanonensis]GLS03096.1 porin [Chitiniphilus shinanonensis]
MFKRTLLASMVTLIAAPAFAEVSIGGSAEMDFFYRTNNGNSFADTDTSGKLMEEIDLIVNIDGKDKLDNGSTLSWRLAQKVATDYRYDSWGQREAWIGYDTPYGTFRFGNQFSTLYLTMLDWPYGANGVTNLTGDFGAHEVDYPRAITYLSPKMSGFSFGAQYDLGSGDGDAYAYEVTAAYAADAFNIDAGFYQGKDSASMDSESASFGGSGWGSGGNYNVDNKAREYFVGGRFRFGGGFEVGGAYMRHEWYGDVPNVHAAGSDKTTVDQYLLRGGYTTGKHNFILAYSFIDDSETDGVTRDDGIQAINFQYTYTLSKQTVGFIQLRHHMLDTAGQPSVMHASYQLDGIGNEDNVTRFLVGTWTGF